MCAGSCEGAGNCEGASVCTHPVRAFVAAMAWPAGALMSAMTPVAARALVAAMRNARAATASAEASQVAGELARLPHEGSLRARRLTALARIDRIL